MKDLKTNRLYSQRHDGLESILRNVRPKVTYDIGSNEGGWVANWLVYGKVVCFEPSPNYRNHVDVRFPGHKDVEFFPLGVGERDEIIVNQQVYAGHVIMPVSASHPVGVALEYVGKPPFDMTLVSLDSFVKNHPVPDFVKLDVDGYESAVLRGGRNLFSTLKPPMMFEYSYLPQLFGENIKTICDLIYSFGYKAVSLGGEFVCSSADEMFHFFPENTSFDILLTSNPERDLA